MLAVVLKAPLDKTWLKALGGIASVVVVLVLIFDRWAWRWLPVAIGKRPKVHGTWKTELQYEWPPGTSQSKECFIVIRQTYSTVAVDMHFDISDSQSYSAAIVNTNGRYSLWWSYLSVAHTLEQEGNPPHRGAAEMVASLKPTLSLSGDYWTERKTRGRLITTGHSKHCYDDYQSALGGTYV